MRFIVRHKGAVLAGIAACFIIIMGVLSFFTKDGTSPASNGINFIFRPLHAAVGTASDRIRDFRDAQERYDSLLAQYDNLHRYVADMDDALRRADQIAAQNDELRELLGLELSKREIRYITANVNSRNSAGWGSTLMLSKGVEAGIHKDMAVISSAGYLVGVISESGAEWSRVTTVIDPNFGCGAKIHRTGQWSVAEGDGNLMEEEGGRLKLRFLSPDADIQNHDLVLTSGEGGIFPNDIPIGDVVAQRNDASGVDSYAVIQPRADLGSLMRVYIIESFDMVE